jgi:hypothetical protein
MSEEAKWQAIRALNALRLDICMLVESGKLTCQEEDELCSKLRVALLVLEDS